MEGEQRREATEAAGGGKTGEEARIRKVVVVVVAVDESDVSLHALSWAIDHLLKSAANTLVLLHAQRAIDHFIYPAAGHAVYATTSVLVSIKKAQEENSRNVISRAMQICREKQVDAKTAIVDGDAKEVICQAAEQMQADLLVVGSRGLGTIKRIFLGSVSDYVAHHAKCPVLIVKPPKENHQ
ncbi:Universal stress protein A-like protein [Ananas comosus]|uniref:Universal stress protein A-like protein n=1 Tax=Ananas comosus TaxID=4615 RepID=A0A199VEZ5_ANACO|nr:Universal stress protein A-like protein [Ananas comosus]